MDLTWLFELL